TKRSTYRFDAVKRLSNASVDAYNWCWTDEPLRSGEYMPYSYYGVYFFGVGVAASMTLCATLPGVPAVIAALITPVDGFITLGSIIKAAASPETIAARKFKKLIH